MGLTNLTYLQLNDNSASDLSPLVANTGLGSGDRVDVQRTPLSYPSIHTHIPSLTGRGVTVNFDNRTPQTLEIVSGNDQQGAPSTALTNPFVVEVRDANGNPFEGVPVTFAVTAGGGSLSTQTTTTDANGQASTTLNLGPNTGTNTIEASVTGISAAVSFTATAQTRAVKAVNIPDTNLRAAIEMALKKGAGATITPAEMETLTRLVAENANISVLTGLERATNLTRLYLRGNSISNITPLSGLAKLTELQLNRNLISDLSPLAGLTNLTDLKLGNNSISNISSLSGLTELTYLGLHNNLISDLSPLVANTGLGSGDTVRVTENPLSAHSINTIIPTLEGRGVEVHFETDTNQAPEPVGTISAQTLTVDGPDATVNVSSNFRDPNNDSLTYTATSDNTRVATVRVSGAVVTITPQRVGSATVTVTASDGTLTATQRIAVTVQAAPRVAHTLVKISGDNQQGAPDAVLANPFVVEVRDAANSGLQGIDVTFAVIAGGGSLSTQTATTDANGQVSTTLTLGSNAGTNTVEASVRGISVSVRFTATAQTLVRDAVNIPDTNLHAAIEKALSKASGTPITAAELATLTSLIAENANISDLTGLERATNLISL